MDIFISQPTNPPMPRRRPMKPTVTMLTISNQAHQKTHHHGHEGQTPNASAGQRSHRNSQVRLMTSALNQRIHHVAQHHQTM
jgi:hypothetical protein